MSYLIYGATIYTYITSYLIGVDTIYPDYLGQQIPVLAPWPAGSCSFATAVKQQCAGDNSLYDHPEMKLI